MNINKSNITKKTSIVVDKKMDKYKGKELFPEKLALASKLLSNAVLPSI